MRNTPRKLQGGGRFDVTVADGVVTKVGDPRAIAREAAGLRAVSGSRVAPQLVSARRGALRTLLVDGRSRPLGRLSPADAHALGAAMRVLHDHRDGASGALAGWTGRVRSIEGYRRRRAADAMAAAGRERTLAEHVVARLPAMTVPPTERPFRVLHGDLVASNILWTPQPRFVDFEFWRMGDPAEDLAYLIEVNALPRRVADSVLDGYGSGSVLERVDAWRALCALDAGLWYRTAAQPVRARRLIARAARLCGLAQTGGITPETDPATNP